MLTMEIKSQKITYLSKTVLLEVQIDPQTTVKVYRWWKQDDECEDYDSDWEGATEKDKKILSALSDEKADEFFDLMNSLT